MLIKFHTKRERLSSKPQGKAYHRIKTEVSGGCGKKKHKSEC